MYQSKLTSNHWLLTRTRKLEVCWNHNTRLMMNLYKILCNKETTSCKDCRLFVAAFAGFLTNKISISSNGLRSDYFCTRYEAIL
ncbi:hypothetical protein H5410_009171 [Solanum commersonii]|uniref:Uncharacterized protein n=1 Tax=Solanum commersonii TaxID=4109 RepID=A0A9J6AHP3_SOLCO|nr:hypothetical protein H5410_009171 [Solanum commersonii]